MRQVPYGRASRLVRALVLLVVSALLALSAATPALAAAPGQWQEQNGRRWYAYEQGGYPANGWALIDGQWYLFDGSGWMLTGWQRRGSAWYYLEGSGAMAEGWRKVGGAWYYLSPGSGAMKTGWSSVEGRWYLHAGSGAMLTGWQRSGGSWYHLASSGAMDANRWVGNYWVGPSGAMAVNAWVDGGRYYVGADGRWVSGGWKRDSRGWWYRNPDGSFPRNRWQKIGSAWYWFDGAGYMAANRWVGNYWVGSSGAMAVNAWVDGGRYYVGSDGAWLPAGMPASSSAGQWGPLHVSGVRLCAADGTPVQLKGVSTHGLAWYPQYVNLPLFKELRSWGATCVRLAVYPHEYGGYSTGGDRAALKQLVLNGASYARQAGLYCIVDWHVLNEQTPWAYANDAVEFFSDISAKLAGQDHVIYEICNEPMWVGWGDVRSYANKVIPVIRANDPDAVIVVGTPEWSQRSDLAQADPLQQGNLMYAFHFYAGESSHNQWLRPRLLESYAAGLPIFVSEFGVSPASGNGAIDLGQADQWVAALDQRGISYVCWSLCNKDESSALIGSWCSKTSGFTDADLSPAGRWLKGVLAR